MYHLPYNKDRKAFARYLRNHSTLGEVLLWQRLRAGRLRGYTFNRQKPIATYIVDFYCKTLRLVIEVDGGYHEGDQKLLDRERQSVLEDLGLRFLRFSDEEVQKDMDVVLRRIEAFIEGCQFS
ncbi:MAG: hypothetical protein JWP69_499 [Flaviaesturariibacter sp.]|nr:hypothetical protein [Flaviaesturariibacter sp.]